MDSRPTWQKIHRLRLLELETTQISWTFQRPLYQLLIEKTFQRQPFILLVETLQVCRYLVGVYLLKTISDWSPLSAEIQISKKISIDLVTFWAESRLQKVIVYIYSKWFLVQVILKFSRFTCSSVLTVFVTFVYFFNA